MSSHNQIIVSAEPRGRYIEGIISGTPKPGTLMQIKAATEMVNGRYTFEVFNGAADGEQVIPLILLEDSLQGKLVTDAYVTGDIGFIYVPIAGEELQVLLDNIAGTSDAFAIGDKLIVNDGDGMFVATTGSPESEPFVVTETLAAITTDTLCKAMFTGY